MEMNDPKKQSDSRDMNFKSRKREKHIVHSRAEQSATQHSTTPQQIYTWYARVCVEASDHNNKLDYKKTLTNIHVRHNHRDKHSMYV